MKLQGTRARQLQAKKNQSKAKSLSYKANSLKNGKGFSFSNLFKLNKDKKKKEKPKTLKGKVLLWTKRVAIALGVLMLFGILGGSITVAVLINAYSKDLPELGDKIFDKVKSQGVSIVTDRNGKELYRFTGDKVYDYQKVDSLNKYFKWSIIAVENPSFYQDSGVSIDGILRAIYTTYIKKEGKVGGSTITQQVIKNLVLTPEESADRSPKTKVREAVLAMQISNKFTKDQVLELYINSIPVGGQYYGVKKGAEVIFGKSQEQLDLAEAAVLAAIPNDPTELSPISNSTTVKDENGNDVPPVLVRQKRVLHDLEKFADRSDVGIKKEDIEAALKEDVKFNLQKIDKKAPWFVDYVTKELNNVYKDKGGIEYVKSNSFSIKTSLDYDTQQIGEEEAKKIREAGIGAQNVGVVSLDTKTGEILTMVGSRDFYDNTEPTNKKFDPQANMVDSQISTGSAIKPFNYLNFFQQGHGPSTIVPNIVFDFGGGYKPTNYFGNAVGEVNMTVGPNLSGALYRSLNIPAVEALASQGNDSFADFMQKLGFDDDEVTQLRSYDKGGVGLGATLGSAAIKPLHLARAFQILANGGMKTPLVPILEIKDSAGKTIYTPDRTEVRAFEEKFGWLVIDIIKDYYPAESVLKNGWRGYFFGKTGTNDACAINGQKGNPTALSFYGATKNIVTGVVAANSDNSCLSASGTGEAVARSVWSAYMNRVLPRYADKKEAFTRPGGVVSKAICRDTGLLHHDGDNCEKIGGNIVNGLFGDGAFPIPDKNHQVAVVATCSDGSEKLANPAQIAAGQSHEKVYTQIPAPYPPLQAQLDAYTHYTPPPKDTCSGFTSDTGDIYISTTSPSAGAIIKQGDSVVISGSAVSAATITKVEFFFDGASFAQTASANFSTAYTVPNSTTLGPHTFKINAADSAGKTGSKTINVVVISPVTLLITQPTSDMGPGLKHITATVNDPNGQVSSVKFNVSKNGTTEGNPTANHTSGNNYQTISPYLFTGPAGSIYTITAIATLTGGSTVNSPAVTFKIT